LVARIGGMALAKIGEAHGMPGTIVRPMAICVGAAHLLLAATFGAQAQVAATGANPVAGAIDFHVHSGPDVSSRNLSDIEIAELAARYGMRAIVLKSHVTMTADRAALVNALVPELEVFGGITLNRPVGGINAAAVRAMATMSGGRGKVVWLPTADSAHHRTTFNMAGEGIVVARDGAVTPETEAVLQLINEHDLVLETGHVSPDEVLTVIRRAREIGIERIVVTHAMSEVPGLSAEQMREATAQGAYLELVYLDHLRGPHAHLDWLRDWEPVSIEAMAEAVRAIGADHFIIASDLGQTGNPIHPDGIGEMIAGMKKAGISEEDIDKMVRRNPARVLGLD
jgi:microsomal dipeptidase-like Zn-dependent dipeptidase